MNNVYVNGTIETIANDRDIVDIIRECCGDVTNVNRTRNSKGTRH